LNRLRTHCIELIFNKKIAPLLLWSHLYYYTLKGKLSCLCLLLKHQRYYFIFGELRGFEFCGILQLNILWQLHRRQLHPLKPVNSVGLICARSLDNSIKVWLSKWRRNSRTNRREIQWEDKMIQLFQHNEKDGTQVFEHLKILNACLKFFVDGLLLFECWAWIFANQQEPLAPKGLPARFLDSVMIQDTVVLCTWVQFVISCESKKSEYISISKYAVLVWLFGRMAVTGFDYMHQGQWWSVRVSACVVLEGRSPNKGLSAKDFNYLQKSEAAHAKAHFWSITCASCTSAFHDLWCTSKQILVLSTKYVLNLSTVNLLFVHDLNAVPSIASLFEAYLLTKWQCAFTGCRVSRVLRSQGEHPRIYLKTWTPVYQGLLLPG